MTDAFASAAETAHRVREREVSAREVAEAALRRIEASDLGAFTDVDGDRALAAAEASAATGPLAGVPVAIKANTDVEGLVCDHGSRLLEGHRPAADMRLVRRLRDAGAVVVGTTKLPEFGILPTTEARHDGPARNPWNRERTPGGSSGGSAAAVAAGLVALAHGNDGGGSIRIPAACCGLVGLKPTRGRISRAPYGDSFLGVDGVLTRTVADTAVALDVLFGYEVGDPTWAPRPAEPLAVAMRRDPGPLRVAVTAANVVGVPVDPESLAAVRDIAETLAGLGHHVEEVEPEMPGPEVLGGFINVFGSARAADLARAAAVAGREPSDDDVEPLSRALGELAAALSTTQYLSQVAELQALSRRMIAFFADWDLMLTPVLAERPLPVGECHGAFAEPLAAIGRAAQFAPYTALFNVTGQPALALPAGLGDDGLPRSVQLVARPLAEETLLAVALAVEAARPWAHLRPAV